MVGLVLYLMARSTQFGEMFSSVLVLGLLAPWAVGSVRAWVTWNSLPVGPEPSLGPGTWQRNYLLDVTK